MYVQYVQYRQCFPRSDDSVFRLAANYVMTLFEDYVANAEESDGNGNESESVPLRSTARASRYRYSYGSIRQASTTTRLGPTRNHTVRSIDALIAQSDRCE